MYSDRNYGNTGAPLAGSGPMTNFLVDPLSEGGFGFAEEGEMGVGVMGGVAVENEEQGGGRCRGQK